MSAASHPFIYFLVYPDPAADGKPRMEVALARAGRIVVRQSAELPAPDASGAIPMSVATLAEPGHYAITVAIQQVSQRVERRLEYTVTGQ